MDIYDWFGLIGLVMVAVGCWLIYPPAALIVPGVLLLGLSLAGVLRRSR